MSCDIIFSVVIPAKNEKNNIARCINSLLLQTVNSDSVEIIVIDNGSTDETASIALSLGARVEIAPNDTIAGLRNRGAALARGEYIAFVDADMEMPPQYLEYFLTMKSNGCDVLGLNIVSGGHGVYAVWENRNMRSGVERVDYLPTANIIMPMCVFEKAGGFDADLATGEDKDLVQRLSAQGAICMISGELTAIHWGADKSLGQFVRKEFWRQKGALALALKNGRCWRLLRFPVVSLVLLLALATAVGLMPWLPLALPLTLGLSFAFTSMMAVCKWKKRSVHEVVIIGALALVRFWVAGLATLAFLPRLITEPVGETEEMRFYRKLAAENGMTQSFCEVLSNIAMRILLGVLLFIPAMAVIGVVYIVVKIIFREPGPFFYAGERLGQYKKPFKLYKIRTLKENASKILGTDLYTADRVLTIKCGDFLRRTRLDELPQIINLIKGDINIIGPRPMRETRLHKFPLSDLRFLVKPGLTGISQLITPHHTQERIRAILDNSVYLSHCSIRLQLKWLVITFYSVVKKFADEISFRSNDLVHRFFNANASDNKRKIRRCKASNELFFRHNSKLFFYVISDINYKYVSFYISEYSESTHDFSKISKATLIINLSKTSKIARCKAKLLSVNALPESGQYKVVMEYTPASEYSRYLIDKYILKECIL